VWQRGNALVPSWVAFAVTRLMEEHFSRLVDYDFTAAMESDLDRIADGEEQRSAWLQRFYFGDAPSALEGLRDLAGDLDEIDAREISTVPLGDGVVLRVGRYGPYVEVPGEDGEPRRATVPDDVPPDELTVERARELLTMGGDEGRVLGDDPATGRTIVVKAGRYGPYVTELIEDDGEQAAPEVLESEPDEAPKAAAKRTAAKKTAKKAAAKKAAAKPRGRTASLFKDMSPETVTLQDALRLLSLPRVVGVDPESGDEITAQNGRYGPYLKKGTDSRSLASEAQLFDLTLEEALAIYAQPKRGRGQAASAPLRELGEDPVSGGPVVVKEGRFGPYVTDGDVNATLRKDDDPASITLERAAELLADKRARGPVKKRGAKKTAAKKTTAKKTAKKATAKKTAKKTAAKKTP
jgi:DNA topoisomerase-1